jgi:hypothetical protein
MKSATALPIGSTASYGAGANSAFKETSQPFFPQRYLQHQQEDQAISHLGVDLIRQIVEIIQ